MIQTHQNLAAAKTNPVVTGFEKFERDHDNVPAWLIERRQDAIARYTEVGLPTLKDEDWRFTNIAPIAKLPVRPAHEDSSETIAANRIAGFPFGKLPASRLVFVNGQYSDLLSNVPPQTNQVRVSSLASRLTVDTDVLKPHLAAHIAGASNAFAALNTAFFSDGACILVPAGCEVREPVHLLFVSTASEPGARTYPRILIIAEKNSRLTVLETYVSTLDAAYFTNSVTELVVGDSAVVEHCKFQDESPSAFHIATLHASLGRSSQFRHHSIATGGRLARNNIKTVLGGEGIDCILNGLYAVKDDQLIDHFMIVEHAKPHCNSHEYFNGILNGKARGVFHGRILVHPEAQKTDAKQTNKNLLLSDEATIDTKPQLEIYADDVKCTHGATIGQLNEESVFYLRARGIGLDTARRMLIHAFAGEIIDRIQFQPARQVLDELIWNRLEQHPQIAAH